MTNFEEYQNRKNLEYGSKFDQSDIDVHLIPYFNSRDRIEIQDIGTGERLRGTIGISTGWKPVFLLMRRITDHSSNYTIPPGRYVFSKVIKKA